MLGGETVNVSLPICCIALVLCAAPAHADDADVLAERLLNAVGGAEIWKSRRFVHTYALNHHPQARLPYTQEGWIDLDEPRHRIELCSYDMQRVRAFTQEGGWGRSEGRSYEFDEERMVNELRGWRARIYRKLRLIATRAHALELEIDGQYLHVTHDDEYLGWIEVDADTGAPVSIGNDRSEMTGTRFGPLAQFGEVAWVTTGRQSGGWNFETISFELLDADAPIRFAPAPADDDVCPRVRSGR